MDPIASHPAFLQFLCILHHVLGLFLPCVCRWLCLAGIVRSVIVVVFLHFADTVWLDWARSLQDLDEKESAPEKSICLWVCDGSSCLADSY